MEEQKCMIVKTKFTYVRTFHSADCYIDSRQDIPYFY